MGSQTAPPCEEFVHWYIASEPKEISWSKLKLF